MKDNSQQDKKKKFKADKERLGILLKLFIVMGMMWIFEVITSIVPFENYGIEAIETIFDVCNALQGVFIFCIFMLKKKVLLALGKKLGITKLRRVSETDTTSTLTSSLLSKPSLKSQKQQVNLEMK